MHFLAIKHDLSGSVEQNEVIGCRREGPRLHHTPGCRVSDVLGTT